MRKAYIGIAVAIVAAILVAIFVPLIPEFVLPLSCKTPCPSLSCPGCPNVIVRSSVSVTYHYFDFGGVLFQGSTYEFRTSTFSAI